MAKINVTGEVMILTSTLKLADIQQLERQNPDALVKKDENGDEIFRVATGNIGKINNIAAVFSGETRDERKLATITVAIPDGVEGDIREVIADSIGNAINNIAEIERRAEEILPEMRRKRASLIASIEVI